jgi:hypothetical protein
MIVTEADIKPNDRLYAALGALAFMLLLFLALLFIIFKTPNPPYPEVGGGGGGGGIELSFGDAPVGMDDFNPDQLSGQAEEVEEVDPNLLTQDVDEDAPTIPPRVNIASAPTKPIEKPKVNNKAIFPNKGGSQGTSTTPGNEGKPNGNPNALFNNGGGKGPGEGPGEGGGKGDGKGKGEGDGEGDSKGPGKSGPRISDNLRARTTSLYKPSCSYDKTGKVRVYVTLDENGKVVSARSGKGTTITDRNAIACVERAARDSKFKVKAGADDEIGYIDYQLGLE